MQKKVLCPSCKKEVIWSEVSPFRPFCSDRCRLIDLGEWAKESYKVPTQEAPNQDESANAPSIGNIEDDE